MGKVEVMAEWNNGTGTEARQANRPAETLIDPEQLLFEELSQIRGDRALVTLIARLVQLSRELRARHYTGQVTLHLSCGLVNSVQREEWLDWRNPVYGDTWNGPGRESQMEIDPEASFPETSD